MKTVENASIATVVGLAALLFAALPATMSAPGNRNEAAQKAKAATDWPIYGGNSDDNHYSSLTQINKSNVSKLQVAWRRARLSSAMCFIPIRRARA
jgi:glucose dehydrogenase